MAKDRKTTTESIEDLLGAMRAQQQTGLLRVEYFRKGRLEEGEIYLSLGQPIYARTARLAGAEALQHLLGWRNYYYSFVDNEPPPPANIFPSFNTAPPAQQTPIPMPALQPVGAALRWTVQGPVAAVQDRERQVLQKNRVERDVFSLGLTRRQRLVYFLIDGRRSVAELVRLTNKTVQEVDEIINELQAQGLISTFS